MKFDLRTKRESILKVVALSPINLKISAFVLICFVLLESLLCEFLFLILQTNFGVRFSLNSPSTHNISPIFPLSVSGEKPLLLGEFLLQHLNHATKVASLLLFLFFFFAFFLYFKHVSTSRYRPL